jgi:hypothetical protein
VVVVDVAADDEEGLLLSLPPQETTNIPTAATATAVASWRIVESLSYVSQLLERCAHRARWLFRGCLRLEHTTALRES